MQYLAAYIDFINLAIYFPLYFYIRTYNVILLLYVNTKHVACKLECLFNVC